MPIDFESIPSYEAPAETAPTDDVETAPVEAVAEPVVTEVAPSDATTLTPEGEPVVTEPVVEPVEAAPVEPPVEVVAAEPAPVPEAVAAALKAAAEALGIQESDPAKIPALLQERREQAEQARQQQEAAKTEETITKAAQEQVMGLINTQAQNAALNGLGLVGELAKGPWYETGAHVFNPETNEAEFVEGPELYRRYEAARIQNVNQMVADPQWEGQYQNALQAGKAAHAQEAAAITRIADSYPHAKDIVADLRRAGVTTQAIEGLAKQTNLAVERAIATTNSAVATQTAELETLRAQVSGHAQALAKAKADGLSEGLNASLAVIQSGRELPVTVGLGNQTPMQSPGYTPKAITLDRIPLAGSN